MTVWIVVVVAAAIGVLSSAVQRSRTIALVFAAGSMALGAAIVVFEYEDALRAARPDASLDGARFENLGRRHVRCAHAVWNCALATRSDDTFHVPLTCGGSATIQANFSGNHSGCGQLPATVEGYLLNMNEAGGDPPMWVLQVGASRTTFPGFLSVVGMCLVVLGFLSPKVFAWSARRTAQARAREPERKRE